jgi:hypothetical protein
MNKNQDCIQFKIIEYVPSKLGLSGSQDIKLLEQVWNTRKY